MTETRKVFTVGIATLDENGREVGHTYYRFNDDFSVMQRTGNNRELWDAEEIREAKKSADHDEQKAARSVDWAADALVLLDERFSETDHAKVLK